MIARSGKLNPGGTSGIEALCSCVPQIRNSGDSVLLCCGSVARRGQNMTTNRLVLAATVAVCAAASTAGQTLSAEDSLKATHETLMRAVTTADAERVAALIHPRALGFFRMSQQVAELEGGSSLQALVETLLRDLG